MRAARGVGERGAHREVEGEGHARERGGAGEGDGRKGGGEAVDGDAAARQVRVGSEEPAGRQPLQRHLHLRGRGGRGGFDGRQARVRRLHFAGSWAGASMGRNLNGESSVERVEEVPGDVGIRSWRHGDERGDGGSSAVEGENDRRRRAAGGHVNGEICRADHASWYSEQAGRCIQSDSFKISRVVGNLVKRPSQGHCRAQRGDPKALSGGDGNSRKHGNGWRGACMVKIDCGD